MLATTSQGSCTARHQGGEVQLPPVQNMQPIVLPEGVEPWMLVQCEVPLVLTVGQGGVFSSIKFGIVLRFLHVSGDLEDRGRRLAEELAWAEQEIGKYADLLNRLRRSLGMAGNWGLEQQPAAVPGNTSLPKATSSSAPPSGPVFSSPPVGPAAAGWPRRP